MQPTSLRHGREGLSPLDWIAALYYPVAFYFCLLVFGLSCFLWSMLASLFRRLLPKRAGEIFGQFMIMLGFRWFIGLMRLTGVLRVDFSELDRLSRERAIVIAPNHPTMLDAVLLTSRLPRVVCITKAAIWDNLFYGGSVRLAAYIRNDAPLPMIRRAAQAIRDGAQLLIFPEGSRTAKPPVDAFHRSFAVMAKAAGAPVQTLLIEADSPYLRKGWPLFRRPELPLVYRIRLGRRFEVGEDPQAFVTGLEAYFREELPVQAPR